MKLRELLALIGGPTMLDDRAERLSGASDELFDDATIVAHLNEAQRRLALESWVLEDTESADACEIDLVENQFDYDLHESVLGIKYARLSDSAIDLARVNYNDNRLHNSYPLNDPGYWDVNVATLETSGRPTRWSADIGIRKLRLRAPPDATAAALTLNLAVVRLPLVELSTSSLDASPEVAKEHHHALAKYAAGSCLAGADVDSALVQKGLRWLKEFDAYLLTARKYRQRQQTAAPRFRFGGWVNGG